MLTVGVDRSWRHLETDHLTDSTLGQLVVMEDFICSIVGDIVLTLNVEAEVMTEMRAPIFKYPSYQKWYLSTGKSLTLVVEIKHCVFRVWEMVCGDYYYWRELKHQIVLGSRLQNIREDKNLFGIEPVGWLQQMEVLVFKVKSKNESCDVFYIVIATGEVRWITPTSKGLVGEFYRFLGPVFPHKNTLVQLKGYY
ncbi:Unknown protein [Striga hermonthica]|uniref:Uncharacterized protein n=1 Tax=Striga hermonthica TaxID=68872 RepID=A0A9N7MPQ8_STRHE|nr:Unknown protein [Striga hermonthica]